MWRIGLRKVSSSAKDPEALERLGRVKEGMVGVGTMSKMGMMGI